MSQQQDPLIELLEKLPVTEADLIQFATAFCAVYVVVFAFRRVQAFTKTVLVLAALGALTLMLIYGLDGLAYMAESLIRKVFSQSPPAVIGAVAGVIVAALMGRKSRAPGEWRSQD